MSVTPMTGLDEYMTTQEDTTPELNLQGCGTQHALALLRQAVAFGRARAAEFLIVRFDTRPSLGERDNLLVPISLYLTLARQQGLLKRHTLLAGAELIQFFIEFHDSESKLYRC
ncbi:MAG: hypothetical protein H6970_07080 [Gammaproteobacteria bacterium]|nr:hypothetical protein [Gammaproteobacteria bacterium]MCP5424817.1 hypothetical protein [Gammaproteobacteria bacterium]MCP5458206.1 hypothetical protein [Gammaproteobacteria bacterium]